MERRYPGGVALVLIGAMAWGAQPGSAQAAGLAAAYAFNEASGTTATDSSGNNNTGTLGSGVTRTTQGRYGSALVFNGTTGRVTVNDAPSLRLASAMTLEAWVNPSAVTSAWRDVIYKGDDNYYLEATSTNGSRPGAGGTFGTAYGTAALAANTWTHLAVTYDRVTIRLYVNGTQVSTLAATAAIATSTNPLQLGSDSLYGQYFQGTIDEVRVYNRALTAAEIQTDMNTPVGGTPPPDTTPPTVAITSPTSAVAYATSTTPLTAAGTAADNVGVSQVTWANDRGGSGPATGTTSWTTAPIPLQPGANVITITAQDAATNQGTDTLTVTYAAPDTQPPTAPTSLTATSNLFGRVSLSWSPATDDVGVAVYNVHRSSAPGFSAASGNRIGQSASLGYTDAVAPGTYYYLVTAQDGAGNVGTPSNQATGASLLSAFSGPLRRSSLNPRYFADGSGRVVYLVGSHTWSSLKDFGPANPPDPFDFVRYLDFLQSHNHDFFRLWTWELPYSAQLDLPLWYHTPFPWSRSGPGLATDGQPKFDLSQPDQSYFDRLRARVVLAGQRGMYVSIMLWDGYGPQFQRTSSDGFPFDPANNINGVSSGGTESQSLTNSAVTAIQEAYARKVIDTVNDLDNVLYEIANEAGSYSTSWQYHMIDLVKQYEAGKPSQHPVGMTYQSSGGTDTTLFQSPADWISPQARLPVSDGTKVILSDTDHAYFWTALKNDGPAAQQAWAWKNFTSGNNVLFMDPYLTPWPGRNAPNGATPDPYWETLRTAMGRTAIYASKLSLSSAIPRGSLFSSGYGLANAAATGAEYLGYSPTGGSLTVDLSASPGTLTVEWFDPTTGVTTSGGLVAGGASRTLTAPFTGDAVAYLRSAPPDTTSPTAPTNLIAAGGTGTVSLSWGAATDDVGVTLYNVHRSTASGVSPTAANRISQVGGLSFVDSMPAGTYYYVVTAQDAAGNVGPPSNEALGISAADTQPPTAPGTLVATAVTSQINLSWTASTDNVGVTGYRLERCQGAGCASFAQIAAPASTTYSDTGLAAGTSYSYRVRAVDAAGNPGPYSNVASGTTPAAASGLVAAYAFNEASGTTATDSSGNNNTGTLGSGATRTTQGRYDSALVFNGTTGRVTINDSPSLRLTNAMTLEAWVNPSAVTSAWRDVIYKGNDNYYLEATSTNGSRPGAGGTFGTAYGTAAVAVNTWTHLAVTYDRVTIRLYVNGVQVSSLAATAAIATSTNPLQLGSDSLYGQYFQGTIDEVRIYNRALTPAEIQTDMNTPVGSAGPPPDTTPPSGTVSINNGAAATNSTTVTLTLAATDTASAVTQMRFSNTGTTYSAAETYATTKTWTLTAGAGTKTVYAQFKDAPGNWSAAATDTIVLDTTAPTISALAASGITSSSAAIIWTTNEPASSQANYGLTTSYGSTTALDPALVTSHSVALTGLAPQTTYNYRVRSRDAAGNESVGANATFTTLAGPDTTPPSAPTNLAATPFSPSQINLSWTASTDNVGVTGYRVFRGGTQIATTSATSYSNTGLAASTLYTYAVAAVDAAGNPSALSASVSATTLPPPDTIAPQVAISFPAPGAQVAAIVTLTADATDNVGVAGVQFRVDGVDAGAEDTAAPYAFSWDTRTVPNGAHTLAARARDAGGNTATSAAITVNVSNSSYFQNEILISGLNLPTNIEFLPDGRMYIGELGGKIWILPPGATAVDPTPFLQLTNIGTVNGQQGLMDLVFDPSFATNHYYYVFYTLGTPNRDRVSRFTANAATTATLSGSELVLYQDPLDANAEHHGGALNFGNDGKLYITTGEHFTGISQDLASPRGKILRINKDGTIPTDNPFYDGAGPNVDSVWARGLRNPFRAFYDSPTGKLYIGDVGGNVAATAQEEVNLGVAGANYGWPICEGPCGNPAVTDPIYWYPHSGRDASITGGFIYRGSQYPSEYYGNYFFADYAQNWIRRLTFDASGNVSGVFNFEPIDGSTDGPYGDIVYLTQGPDGALYYVDLGYSDTTGTYGISKIRRIRFIQSNLPPVAAVAASPTEGPDPLTVNFSSAGSSDPEGQALTYAWTFGDGATSTAANPVHTYTQRGKFTVRLSVSDGVNMTLAAPLFIAVGNPPTATILAPTDGIFFRAGDVISFSGEGSDTEDGTLPPGAFTWVIDFLHEGHVHPGLPQSGVLGGTFTIPTSGHDFEGNTRYRISLTVADSDGLTATQSVLVYPEKVNLSFATTPAGLTLYLDGVARTAPFVADTLVNFVHTIDARNQVPYAFASWSDGGAQQHLITAPPSSQSYTATFIQTVPPPPAGLVAAWGFNEAAGTTAADASPNGNVGTLVNGPTWTTGKNGGALQFDGVDDRVRVSDSNSLDLTTGSTFEAWVYPTVAPAGWRTIMQKEVDAYFFTASSDSANRPASGGTFSGTCCAIVYGPSALPVNVWTHVAGTYDGGQLRVFVNGTQVAATIVTGSYQVNSNPLWIGGNAVYGEHFQGRLDDLRLYNRALTPAEIQQDMGTPVP